MKSQVSARLPEYVLGLLSPAEMGEVGAVIGLDPALLNEVDELRMALTKLLDQLPPLAPSPEVRARLFTSVGEVARFGPFVAPLARLLHLSLETMRAILGRIEDAAFWEKGLPGLEFAHFDPGPPLAEAGADAGFIRFEPGSAFPRHKHLVGREITFVLEGTLVDDGREFGPGSVIELDRDSEHAIAARADQPLLIMVVHHGIAPVF
jgi:hypothetical protein